MLEEKVDMHTHTNLSNGFESLEFVLSNAEENGVKVLSITDFNTLEAYFRMENMDVRKYYTGSIVAGVEVNCKFDHFCSDMLGYNIKDKETLQQWLSQNTGKDNTIEAQMEQLEHYKNVARKLKARFDEGIKISKEQFYAGKVIANNLGLYPENIGIIKGIEKPQNFFVEHCANINSPFYFDLSVYRPKLSDFINVVHDCGGIVFVAHPFAYAHSEKKLQEYLEVCHSEGVDGIECFQSYNENIAYASEIPLEFCRKYGLYASGGTDFHKRGGDGRYSGVGILGGETVRNYTSYIPKSLVEPWIEPMRFNKMGR